MYKVFINDRPLLFLSETQGFESFLKGSETAEEAWEKAIELLASGKSDGLEWLSDNVEKDFKQFCSSFENILAAGGVVYNEKGQILGIKRLGRWDLPKGKWEQGENIEECARREVAEECGVPMPDLIDQKAYTTYHMYLYRGKWVLKPTHWYAMQLVGKHNLSPQVEEQIEAVKWCGPTEMDDFFASTYPTIIELLQEEKEKGRLRF